MSSAWWPWLVELWAAPAALGFALLFNVPPRALPACGVLAILGHATRLLIMKMGGDIVLATLVGATLIGVAAELWANRQGHIGAIYAISAAIPMVPGTSMYRAVQGLLRIVETSKLADPQGILVDAGINAARASMILMALAFGIAAPILLWPQKKE